MACSRVTYRLQWSMFSGCGVFPVLIAAWWIVSWHDCCSLTRPGQGNRQTMLGGGRKAWSKTLQSTTREVSFSFSFPKSLSCDVVLPSPPRLCSCTHITQSIWCLRWRIGNWCILTHYPLTQDNVKAQAATTEMVFVYRECMICVGDWNWYTLFQCSMLNPA